MGNQYEIGNQNELNNQYDNNELMKTYNKIDFDRIADVYGTEIDGAFICNVCGVDIKTTDVEDFEDFHKGEDGGVIKTRELTEAIPIIKKQKEYIEKMITNLTIGNELEKEMMKKRIHIFKTIKELSHIEHLNNSFSVDDEVEMLNFLKSFTFETKDRFYEVYKKSKPELLKRPELLSKLINNHELNYMIADIGARFLILLQTSKINYKLPLDYNSIGYPLINDDNEKGGVEFIMYILSKMIEVPEYVSLDDKNTTITELKLIERIKKQVENDNLVKNKLITALDDKSNTINTINEFENYYSNRWREFKPRLEYNDITWHPVKLLNSANLKEVSYANIDKMINVGNENKIYYALNVINKINTVIDNSTKSNYSMLLNNCCPEEYKNDTKFDYMNYFNKKNSEIPKTINLFSEVTTILSKIKSILNVEKTNIVFEPLYKPSEAHIKVNYETIENEDVKEMYKKYIEKGIYKGKEHIYDKYGRCILSNVKKVDIEKETYNIHSDYNRIKEAIYYGNTFKFRDLENKLENETCIHYNYDDGLIDNFNNDEQQQSVSNKCSLDINLELDKNVEYQQIEKNKIKDIIKKIPKLSILDYLKDFFNKIEENEDDIFTIDQEQQTQQTQQKKQQSKQSMFDIYKQITNLKNTIDNEIDNIVKKITSTEKNYGKYKTILTNLGDFKQLYEDYKLNHSGNSNDNDNNNDNDNDNDYDNNYNSHLFRDRKKEEYLQFSIKFLNDVMNQIKYGKLSNPIHKESIRLEYRSFINYGEKETLFNLLSETTRELYYFVKGIKSKEKYKLLFPEFVSTLLHYINVISLSNLYTILNKNNIGKKESDIIDYEFKVDEEPNRDMLELNKELNLGLEDELLYDTEEDNNVNFIENFEIKKSNNIKIVNEFILSYLDYIDINQKLYDSLTDDKIKKEITQYNQKKIERTLNTFKKLSEEGNEYKRAMLMAQMKITKTIDYKNLSTIVDEMTEQDQNEEALLETNDSYEIYNEFEHGDSNDPDYIDTRDTTDERDQYSVFSSEDDVGDQDYHHLAVDE
jgi:hypothetical protein